MLLIVDDREDSRRVLNQLLALQGYKSVEAASGREALAVVRATEISLVILDFNMPDIDGLAVFREMRSDPQLRSIPVIMFSATDGTAKAQALREGVNAWIMKGSLDFAALHREVARLIGAPRTPAPPIDAPTEPRARDVG